MDLLVSHPRRYYGSAKQEVERCAQLFRAEPGAFRFAVKWVPVDHWCEKDLEAMFRLIEERVAPAIGPQETWALKVEKRGWPLHHTADIIRRLELLSIHAPSP